MMKPAYPESYLESIRIKIKYLFRLIAHNCPDTFERIKQYMECEYRTYMDMGNPLYLNKSPKQILGSMGIAISPEKEISGAYDEFILDWMADIYTCMQWEYGLASSEIVEKIPPERLYRIYNPLHEASLKNGMEKLLKILGRTKNKESRRKGNAKAMERAADPALILPAALFA